MADKPIDIRTVSPDEYWDVFEQQWTSLLSYRYLGRNHDGLDAGVEGDIMHLRHDMRNVVGGIMVAPLCIASPETGGMADDLYVPNPVSASMMILDDAKGVSTIEMSRETLRTGRNMGFSRTTIYDRDDPTRVIALSSGLGISLGGTPGGYEKVENPTVTVVDSPDLPPLWKVFGAERRDDGAWILPELTQELSSPDAALHLGPQHIVLETAATEMAAAQAGTDRIQIIDWNVMYAARGKVGPFRTAGAAHGTPPGRIGVHLALYDEGNDDRLVTSATATFELADQTAPSDPRS